MTTLLALVFGMFFGASVEKEAHQSNYRTTVAQGPLMVRVYCSEVSYTAPRGARIKYPAGTKMVPLHFVRGGIYEDHGSGACPVDLTDS